MFTEECFQQWVKRVISFELYKKQQLTSRKYGRRKTPRQKMKPYVFGFIAMLAMYQKKLLQVLD
jgi:hypothetical protein